MKKILILTLMCISIAYIFAAAQSMRNVASNGVFDGDWEKVFDPIKLKDVDSLYFFTNLADFNIEYTELWNDYTYESEVKLFEELPLGIAFKNPYKDNMRHSLFFRFRKTRTPEYLADGYSGEFEKYTTTYSDLTGDGVYDIKRKTHIEESGDMENESLFAIDFNTNIKLEELNLGIKLSSWSEKEEDDNLRYYRMGIQDFGNYGIIFGSTYNDDNNYTLTELYNLDEDEYYLKTMEKGDYSQVYENTINKIEVSVENEHYSILDDSNLRLDFGIEMSSNLGIDNDYKYNASYEEIVVRDTLVKTGNVSDRYKYSVDQSRNDFYLGATIKKYLDESFAGEKGFWETGFTTGLISGDREQIDEDHMIVEEKVDSLLSEEYTQVTTSDELSYVKESGDLTGFHIGAHFLTNLPLNKYAMFGAGGYYNYSNTCGDYDYINKFERDELYQEGALFNTQNEFIVTERAHVKADKQTIIRQSVLEIPVALEMKVPEDHTTSNDGFGIRNFVFRLGSTFTFVSTEIESTYDVKESNPGLTITENGIGEISESHASENTLISRKGIQNTNESNKIFSAGIGYKHSNNLSIDFGGNYNRDTKEYFMGISFTVKK